MAAMPAHVRLVLLVAAALDAGLFARARVIDPLPPPLAPTLRYHRSGVTLGIAGSF